MEILKIRRKNFPVFKLKVDMKLGDLIRFNYSQRIIHPDDSVGIIVGEVYTDKDGDQLIAVYWMDINEKHDEDITGIEVISEASN